MFAIGAKSYHGLSLDVVSSGVQKSLRRRSVHDLEWFVTEWLLFKESAPDKPAILTNCFNRVNEIMTVEDILGFTEPDLLLYTREVFSKWKESEYDLSHGRSLIPLIRVLSQARMLRIGSDLKALCYKPTEPINGALKDKHIQVQLNLWRQKVQAAHQLLTPHQLLNSSEFLSIVKLYFQLSSTYGDSVTGFHRALMNALCVKNQDTFLQLMCDRYKTKRKERFLFMIHALLYCWTEPSPRPLLYPPPIAMTTEKWNEYLAKHKSSPCMEIPSYVLDKHTAVGRQQKKSRSDFVLEGSLVVNQDPYYFNPEWRKAYIDSASVVIPPKPKEKKKSNKKKRAHSSTESEVKPKKKKAKSVLASPSQEVLDEYVIKTISKTEVKAIRHLGWVGQRVTCKWKQCTYITPIGVFKGPFNALKGHTIDRLILTLKRYRFFIIMDIPVPGLFLLRQEDDINMYWLQFNNISDNLPSTWRLESKEVETMINGEKARIIDRRSMGLRRANELTAEEWAQHPTVMVEILLILGMRYVLDPMVGDSGLWNILVRSNDMSVWCIDYEENRELPSDPSSSSSTEQWIGKLCFKRPWIPRILNVFDTVRGSARMKERMGYIEGKLVESLKTGCVVNQDRWLYVKQLFLM